MADVVRLLDIADLPSPGWAILADRAVITLTFPSSSGSSDSGDQPAVTTPCLSILFRGTHVPIADVSTAYPDGLYSSPALSSQRLNPITLRRETQTMTQRLRPSPATVLSTVLATTTEAAVAAGLPLETLTPAQTAPNTSGWNDLTDLDRAIVVLASWLQDREESSDASSSLGPPPDVEAAWRVFWPHISTQSELAKGRLKLPTPESFLTDADDPTFSASADPGLRWPLLAGESANIRSSQAVAATSDPLAASSLASLRPDDLQRVVRRIALALATTAATTTAGPRVMVITTGLSHSFLRDVDDDDEGELSNLVGDGQLMPHILVGWMLREDSHDPDERRSIRPRPCVWLTAQTMR